MQVFVDLNQHIVQSSITPKLSFPITLYFTMGFFDLSRKEGFPTQYAEEKTPVTVDVLEAGLILAFVIIGTAFFIIILGLGIRRSTNAVVKVFCSIAIGCCLMLANFGQEWEVGSVATKTPYRAGNPHEINATISIKLGLRSVNVTLKGNVAPNTPLENETINYNERFWWTWDQGRLGFGPYAGLLQRSFREAQRKGLPIPILSVVEYFVVDGEGLRFGRFYRTAGWYTHILLWTAFATWILANIFLISVGRYAAYFLALTGGLQILACIVWSAVRNPYPLIIPFEDGKITTSYGPNFHMALVCGIICLLLGTIIFIMDLRFPDELSSFLGIDPIADYDELVITQEVLGKETGKTPHAMEMQSYSDKEERRREQTMTILKRRSSVRMAQKSLFRHPLPVPVEPIDEGLYDDTDIPIYENQMHVIQGSMPGPSMQRDTSCSKEELCPPLPQKKKIQFQRN